MMQNDDNATKTKFSHTFVFIKISNNCEGSNSYNCGNDHNVNEQNDEAQDKSTRNEGGNCCRFMFSRKNI